MEISKRVDTTIKHWFNYCNDNQIDSIEQLYTLGIITILILKKPMECNRARQLRNEEIYKDFKDYFQS